MSPRVGLAVVLSALCLSGCAETSAPLVAPTASSAVPSSLNLPPELMTPAAPAANCEPAAPELVKVVDNSFTPGEHLADTFTVTAPSRMIYLGGVVIDKAGKRAAEPDVWLAQQSGGKYEVYSLSEGARTRTPWPDGRKLGTDADMWGQAVRGCVG